MKESLAIRIGAFFFIGQLNLVKQQKSGFLQRAYRCEQRSNCHNFCTFWSFHFSHFRYLPSSCPQCQCPRTTTTCNNYIYSFVTPQNCCMIPISDYECFQCRLNLFVLGLSKGSLEIMTLHKGLQSKWHIIKLISYSMCLPTRSVTSCLVFSLNIQHML